MFAASRRAVSTVLATGTNTTLSRIVSKPDDQRYRNICSAATCDLAFLMNNHYVVPVLLRSVAHEELDPA